MITETQIVQFDSIALDCGSTLEHVDVAFETYGELNARKNNAILVLHAFTGDAHAAGTDKITGAAGWWDSMIGAGKGFDTDKYFVICSNILGGCRGTSGPGSINPENGCPYGMSFPPVTIPDMVRLQKMLVDHLGIERLHAIVGASYGGMVALCFAERHAALVERIVVLSAADKSQVLSTAWRSVQRQIVREAIARGDGPSGLKLARALAMATYRSAVEFELRFGGAPVRLKDRFRFPIEDYLFARGDDYVQKYRAETFLALSESIDLHSVDATRVRTPATLIAVREDQLVPFADMQGLAARLNGPRQLIEINSIFGHDAFLKEGAALTPIIKRAVSEPLL